MNTRTRLALIAMACLPAMPGVTSTGICYNVAGLCEAAGFDITPLAGAPLVGEAQGATSSCRRGAIGR
jgi:hypothetical protein